MTIKGELRKMSVFFCTFEDFHIIVTNVVQMSLDLRKILSFQEIMSLAVDQDF